MTATDHTHTWEDPCTLACPAYRQGAHTEHARVAQVAERPVDRKPPGMAPVVDWEVAGSSPAPGNRAEFDCGEDDFIQCPHEAGRATCVGSCNCPCEPCAPSRPRELLRAVAYGTERHSHGDIAELIYAEVAMFAHSRGTWKPRELADHLATYLAPYVVYPPGRPS